MRKNISSIFILFSSFLILFVVISRLTTPAYADPFTKIEEKDLNILPNLLCALFRISCTQGVPDPNQPTPYPLQPTPPYPTPEIMPTAMPPVPGACAPRGGAYLCGSRSTPRANCGHCGLNYNTFEQVNSCDRENRAEIWGTAYAIDISMKPGQPILLPPIEGQNVIWYHYAATRNGIQKYQANVNRKAYIVTLHHTQLGSGIGIGKEAQSGQVGARVCQQQGCDHVHIQINQGGWKSATSYYCFP